MADNGTDIEKSGPQNPDSDTKDRKIRLLSCDDIAEHYKLFTEHKDHTFVNGILGEDVESCVIVGDSSREFDEREYQQVLRAIDMLSDMFNGRADKVRIELRLQIVQKSSEPSEPAHKRRKQYPSGKERVFKPENVKGAPIEGPLRELLEMVEAQDSK